MNIYTLLVFVSLLISLFPIVAPSSKIPLYLNCFH
jgi:hypothetical protein